MPKNVTYSVIHGDDLRRVIRGRRSFWLSLLITTGLITLAGAASYLGWLSPVATAIPSRFWPGAQLALALTPAVLWLAIFAIGERQNDAVRRTAFLLWFVTAVLYLVIVAPLLTRVFQINEWLYTVWWSELTGKFLITAPLETSLIYLVLRYGVYPGDQLQSLLDGPLFGVATALGVATMVNLLAVRDPGFENLNQGILFVSETALGYAALGALLGYFLAQARFRRTTIFFLAAGMFLTIILHALFFFSLHFINAQNLFLNVLNGLIFADLFALLCFWIIYWRLRQDNKTFMHTAALVDRNAETLEPKSLLADVVNQVAANALAVRPSPLPPHLKSPKAENGTNELDDLKHGWDALIAEQEADNGSV